MIHKHLLPSIVSIVTIAVFLLSGCDSDTVVQQDNIPPPTNQMPGTATQNAVADSNLIPNQYIVVYESPWEGLVRNATAQQALAFVNERINEVGLADSSVKSRYEYVLRGFTAKLTDVQLARLKNDPKVKYIEQDQKFKAHTTRKSSAISSSSGSQTIPWGVSRIYGPLDGTGKKAWILDSGIDLNHPDLNVDVVNSASFVANETADDQVGHGTHVAGILAAIDNNQDVVGVAAGASIVSVKVLPSSGPGIASEIIDGINYVAGKASTSDVINMSLGGPTSQVLDNAVISAADDGLRFSISAGNDKVSAITSSPGRVEHPNVWTISAFKQGDDFAVSFDCNINRGSNFSGPTSAPIEYSMPGNNIPSLSIGGGTIIDCGTSMSAPHFAGLLLAAPNSITTDGVVSNDPDSDPDPIAVYDRPLMVSVSGPRTVDAGQMNTWTANPQHSPGPYSYQWYYINNSTSGWIADGTDSDTYSRSFSQPSSTYYSHGVRVVVTNSSEQAEGVKYVIVTDDCDPASEICVDGALIQTSGN